MNASLRRFFRSFMPGPNFPRDENGQTLSLCWKSGDRLEIERPVNFSVLFPGEMSAKAAVARVSEIADRVDLRSNDEWKKWDMTAIHHMKLTHAGITSYELKLAEVVSPFQGSLDGGDPLDNRKDVLRRVGSCCRSPKWRAHRLNY